MKGAEELLHQWDRVEMQHLQHAVTSDVVTSAEGGVSAVLRAAVLLSGTQAEQAASASAVLGSLAQLPQHGCQKGAQGTCT